MVSLDGVQWVVGLNNAVDAVVSEEEPHLIGIFKRTVGAELQPIPGSKSQRHFLHFGLKGIKSIQLFSDRFSLITGLIGPYQE